MGRRLETLEPGTPVLVGAARVGEVRGVYAEGDSRVPEMLVVHWEARGETVVVPTSEVANVTDDAVTLMQSNTQAYADLAAFDAARFPTVRKLA